MPSANWGVLLLRKIKVTVERGCQNRGGAGGSGTYQGMEVRAFAGGGRCTRGVLGDACREVGTRASVRWSGCARGRGVRSNLEAGGGVLYQQKV